MVVTRKRKITSSVTTRKVGALTCLSKSLPINLWCHCCSDSRNFTPTQKPKPCSKPWISQVNDSLKKRKHYEIIKDYFIQQSIEFSPKK